MEEEITQEMIDAGVKAYHNGVPYTKVSLSLLNLVLNENIMRKMGCAEYYKTASWLRSIRRMIADKLPSKKYFEEKMSDLIVYGRCEW